MEELKPCRCGNNYLARYEADHNGVKNTYVYCDICGRRESIYTWNNRKDIDAQAAEIERLKAKIEELETDNARLREALEKIDTIDAENPHPDRPWKWGVMNKMWEEHDEMKRIAKQALLNGEG